MEFITDIDWIPASGITLENSALEALKKSGNVTVMAGPGAGKTELLAQKAGFLFQTGKSGTRKKILAISFKTDAAKNLEDRVKIRYGSNLSLRFESKTFDSFAKGLLDQFIWAIPEDYRPPKNYDIILMEREINRLIKENLLETNPHYSHWQYEYEEKVFNKQYIKESLPLELVETDLYSWLVSKSWLILVKGTPSLNSSLSFPMISLIVEYLLRANPQLIKALRSSYAHVFLDEFQDTTDIQYKLLKTLFKNSNVSITAVGDDKQRIMGWAGAMSNAFESFKEDFNSNDFILSKNFRSAPKLVEIQNIFSQTLNKEALSVISAGNWDESDGVCEVWISKDHISEGEFLASSIQRWTKEESLSPKDVCIIVKQQEQIYGRALMDSLEKLGINSRLEKEYQDLLADECVNIVVAIIQLSFTNKHPELWLNTVEWLIKLKIRTTEKTLNESFKNLETSLSQLTQEIGTKLLTVNVDNCEDNLEEIIKEILEFINMDDIRSYYPKYKHHGLLESTMENVKEKIALSYSKYSNWEDTINDFKGYYSIPIMTIHKSKGLEYNTVIFIGLEDDAFWNFNSQAETDKKAFFVALSRAKKRVIFTFSKSREVMQYRRLTTKKQSITNISEVYRILERAGVPIKEL